MSQEERAAELERENIILRKALELFSRYAKDGCDGATLWNFSIPMAWFQNAQTALKGREE